MNKPFALIGAELRGNDIHANYQTTNELRQDLINLGLSFVGVTNVSRAKKSQLFLVVTSDEATVIGLAKKYNQKAILVSDSSLNMDAISVRSQGRTKLGKLTSVSEQVAKMAQFFITFEEDGKTHFYVTKQGAAND